jgi:hypothetical protein
MLTAGDNLPHIIAQTGPLSGQSWTLNDCLTIGRDSSCSIIISDRQISRIHARLSLTSEGVLLEDLGSKNGTHHNGKEVTDPVMLVDGDTFQIALAQQFVFISSDATLPLNQNKVNIPLTKMPQVDVEFRLMIDERAHQVFVDGNEINPPLSAAQFQLLALLYRHSGEVVTRADLVSAVWEDEIAAGVSEQALDALIRRLRDRLAAFDPSHMYIHTVRGHGIRLDNPPANS